MQTLCQKAAESINHVASGYSKLAQQKYKKRHDSLGKIVNWKLAGKCNFEAGDKWCEHKSESVLENEPCEISVFRLTMLQKLGYRIWL